jgi:hypothetical protein
MLLKNTSILVIDDDIDVLTAMNLLLKSQVKEVVVEKNPFRNMLLKNEKLFIIYKEIGISFSAFETTSSYLAETATGVINFKGGLEFI